MQHAEDMISFRRLVLALGAGGLLLTPVGPAAAHIAITYPKVRYPAANPVDNPQKDGPCGQAGGVRTDRVCTYRPGSTITMEWDETIEHAGHYRVSFDTDGADFINPSGPNDTATGDGVTIFKNDIPDRVVTENDSLYPYELTFPDIECDNCTLQLLQVMSTANAYVEGNMYYQCADIVLSADAPETPEAGCALASSGPGGDEPDAGGGGGGGGGAGGGDAGVAQGETITSGAVGGCRAGGGAQGAGLVVAGLAALLALARRRRA